MVMWNNLSQTVLLALISGVIFANLQTVTAGRKFGKNLQDGLAQVTEDHHDRKGKAFSLFNVVQFENGPCASTQTISGSNSHRNGTCFTSTECQDKGGMAMGNCAAGFGVCCIFIVDDNNGGPVNHNCSYIQNPDYTSATTTAGTYTYTINRCNGDVCYIRLDFETFTILGTGVTDESQGCTTDTLTIQANTNQRIPTICGENRGQHMYFDIDQTATVTITIGGANPSGTWDIKVSQIECQNPMAPPNGCLQYSTGLTGRIETFNWANTESHLYDLDYSHCVRQEAGFCCVQYQTCSGLSDPTGMSLQVADATGAALLIPAFDDACITGDFVEVQGNFQCVTSINRMRNIPNCSPKLLDKSLSLVTKYCGPFVDATLTPFEVPICDCSPPFYIHVFTDALPDSGDAAIANAVPNPISRGLCVEYTHVPC